MGDSISKNHNSEALPLLHSSANEYQHTLSQKYENWQVKSQWHTDPFQNWNHPAKRPGSEDYNRGNDVV